MADNYSIEASISADISKFKKAIQKAKEVTQKFKRESDDIEDTELDTNIKPLKRNLKKAKLMMDAYKQSAATDVDVDVDVNDSKAKKKIGFLMAAKLALSKKVVIPIEARIKKFQSTMSRIANTINAFGAVAQNTFRGLGITLSSMLVPIIASLVPAIMAVGNAVGVLGSGIIALGTAFGIAGGAAIAYGAAALPTIKSIIDGTAKSTKENIRATKQFNSLKSAWQGVQDAIAPDVAIAFGNAMEGIKKALVTLNPMFITMADTIATLSGEFKEFMDSSTAQAFFGYLNKTAAPIFGKIVSGITGFIKGLMNLTVAFAPLTDFMAEGFAKMGDSFSNFTERVAGSKQLQTFISYVKTNLPIIKGIFGDVFMGIINLFAAFGDNSAIIFTKLSEMAASFRTWSETIKQSDGFQKFIQYVQENGPKVIAFIGNMITFIINLGIALAPMGSALLDIINKVISFTNSLMENHPVIGKIIAIMTVLTGVIIAIVPNIIAVVSAFGGMASFIMLKTGMMRAKLVTGIGMMIKSLGAFVVKMVSAVASFAVQATKFIAKWVMMGIKSTINGAKMAAAWALATGKKMAVAATKMLATSAMFVTKWALMGTKSLLGAGKVASAWALATGKALATAMAKMIAQSAIFVAKWVWVGAQSLIQAARVAAAWFIALGPVGWVIATVIALVALIIANWDSIKKWTVKIWNSVWDWIKDTWQKVWGKTREVTSDLVSTVKGKFSDIVAAIKQKMNDAWDKITGIWDNVMEFFEDIDLAESGRKIIGSLVDGIGAMKDKVVNKVKGIAGAIRDFFPFSPAKTGPLKTIDKMDFGTSIAKSINNGKRIVTNASARLAKSTSNSFNPDLQVKSSQITSSLRGLKRNSVTQVSSAVNADIKVNNKQPANINLNLGGHNFKTFVSDITRTQERESKVTRDFA